MRYLLLFFAMGLAGLSCQKYLDARSDQRLAIPSTYDDLEAILNNAFVLNVTPGVLDMASDEYYLTPDYFNALEPIERTAHVWADSGFLNADWNNAYKAIFAANTALAYLGKVSPRNAARENYVRGSALFYRAWQFFQLSQVFMPVYSPATLNAPAVPLRLTDDFNEASIRPTVADYYAQMVGDLEQAVRLLPAKGKTVEAAGQSAAHGLLARIHLVMGNYVKAGLYADSALSIQSFLIDYNILDAGSATPIASFNPEVIFQGTTTFTIIVNYYASMDTLLLQSYAPGDLRPGIFFLDRGDGTFSFKGNYNSNFYDNFQGMAVDEMLLIKAECAARGGATVEAMTALNTLLEKRFSPGFVPLSATTAEEALSIVLAERKKELIFRGLRWNDLRRYNRDGANFSLSRQIGTETYVLPPGDPRWTWLIPLDVINLSGIGQNPR